MNDKPKRNRLLPIMKGEPAIIDPMAFEKNKCSDRARLIASHNANISTTIWFDQHYVNRQQHGDDNGLRLGIEKKDVEALVLVAVKHLMFYSAVLPTFTFLTHIESVNPIRGNRLICRKESDDGMLNVVIEAHYDSVDNYEITVFTAMCADDFRVADNQCVVEIVDGGSILYRMVNNRLTEIYRI